MEEAVSATVLNVDDNEAARYALSWVLKQAGFEVLEAATGVEALKLAQEFPDLILLDVNLPDISGFEVCRRLKSDPVTRHIPVLHISATYLDSKSTVNGLEGGADGYLTEPVEPPVLLAHINALIRSSRLEKQLIRVNRALKAVTYCHQVLLRAETESELAEEVCRVLVEVAGYRFVWVGYADRATDEIIRPVGKWGHDEGLFEVAGVTSAETDAGCCPMGEAIRTAEPVLLKDIMTDSRCGSWRAEVLKRGFVSAFALPLVSGSDVFGGICIWSDKIDTFDQEERALLLELVQDLSYGIRTLRTREEARLAHEAVKESEERYSRLVETMSDGLSAVDENGVFVYVNKKFCEMLDYAKEELIGRKITDFMDDEARHRFNKQFSLRRSGSCDSYEQQFIRKGGEKLHVIISPTAVFDPDGTFKGSFGVATDITQLRRMEDQLRQAQKMEAVGTLAGGVAHDFNNLLQVICGYSELILSDKDLPGHYRDDLVKIHKAARSGADLVQRLLTFSKKAEFKPLPLNLNWRIAQIQKLLSRTIPKMIEIELVLADNLPHIDADPSQVEQIVMNLALNARDAMPDGGRLVIETDAVFLNEEDVKAHMVTKPGQYVLLSISDTGKGMDKVTQDRIFEPFFTTKAPGGGTGLGLAVVYGIVVQLEGSIKCYSEPSKGTTFKIYFPALVSREEIRETEPKPLPHGGSETILLVDDEELVRELTVKVLTKAGYKVITAADGNEALDLYLSHRDRISMVILDLIMPGMGGKQCLEELLNLDPSVKVVIASGYSPNGRTKRELAAGAKGFIDKPYNMHQVLEVVRRVLDTV